MDANALQELALSPLTAEAFAPFGDVIDSNAHGERYAINTGLTERLSNISAVDCDAEGGSAAISIFKASTIPEGFVLRTMENHPLGSQSFVNCSGAPYAIVVAPAGHLDESAIRGFFARPDQSITYRRGTWHHFLLSLGGSGDFVVVDRVGPGNNCIEQTLTKPLRLSLQT